LTLHFLRFKSIRMPDPICFVSLAGKAGARRRVCSIELLGGTICTPLVPKPPVWRQFGSHSGQKSPQLWPCLVVDWLAMRPILQRIFQNSRRANKKHGPAKGLASVTESVNNIPGEIGHRTRCCLVCFSVQKDFKLSVHDFEDFILTFVEVRRNAESWRNYNLEEIIIARRFGAGQLQCDLHAKHRHFPPFIRLQDRWFVRLGVHAHFLQVSVVGCRAA